MLQHYQVWKSLCLTLWLLPVLTLAAPTDTLFQQHCASCHGQQRLGGMGPALLPENLSRLRKNNAIEVIGNGRAATQMPAFKDTLNPDQIQALADYIYQPPASEPQWTLEDMQTSHIQHYDVKTLPTNASFEANLQNLFIVVELGDHHATLLDGDSFTPIHRFATRFALHGGPKYSPDGRFVYFASRDGWISKFDIYNLKTVAEIRAGINTRNMAVSFDGRYAMVANYLPHNLVLLDTESMLPMKVFPVEGRVSAVYTAPPRNSFVAALKDSKTILEIPYGSRPFPVRSITTDTYLDDFFFDQNYQHLIGASREGDRGQVIDLDSGKAVASIPLAGMPHLGSGISWEYQGKTVMATPHLKEGKVSIIDMDSWQVIKQIDTLGPGFFMRSHDNSPYAWVDVFFGPNKDAVHLIDKRTLQIAHTLKPEPGKTAAHVEFTQDGRYALLSLWEEDGAVIVYDAETLREVKRLPMRKPSGKYNVYNKTHYAAGTSH
ncbi:MAG: cytochrome C oxidase Cbb3 [Pseudomonadales bacterium]|nr:cytochrome C oxidase Cbb3 [Pseudomonadales bacterium]